MVNSRFCQRVLFLTALVCWLTAGCGDEPLSSPVSISSVEGNGSTPDKIAKPGTIIVTGSGFQVGDEIQVRNPSNGTVNTSGVLGSRYVSDTRLELDIDPDTFEAGKRTLVVARSGVPVAKASVTFLTGPEGPPGPPGSYIAGEGLEIIPSMIGDATINLKLATDGGLSKTLGAANDELGLAPGGVRAEHLSSMGATTTGQVLKWNNATGQWEPGIDDGSTYVAGTGIEIVGMGDTFTISAKIGTGSDEVAAGNHDHSGIYAPISHQHSGADITSGTVADARLSSNVMLLDTPQVVTASKTFGAPIYLNDAAGVDATYRENGIDRNSGSDVTFEITNSGAGGMTLYVEGGKVWTSTNDGSGSTLDADLLDGRHESEFALLGGRAGGQTIYGGTGSGENLTLNSTSNATKGTVYVNSSGGNVVLASSTGGMVGVRTSSPQEELDVNGNLRTSSTVAIASTGTALAYNRFGVNTTTHSLSSSNDVLVSGKLEVDGTLYADSGLTTTVVSYVTPSEHSVLVQGFAFVPMDPTNFTYSYSIAGARGTSGTGAIVAPFYIPDKATITKVKFCLYDNDASNDIYVALRFVGQGGWYSNPVAQYTTSGSPGWANPEISASFAVPDGYGPVIVAYPPSGSTWSSSLQVSGTLITYTLAQAP